MSEVDLPFQPRDGEEPIRGHVRSVGHDRVSHGLFLPEGRDEDDLHRWFRVLHAWLQVLARGAVFTHLTAVRLYGWWEPKLPEQVPVFAAVGARDKRPRRPGLVCSRVTRKRRTILRCGFPVDEAEEVLLRCARDLGVLDMVILIDSAWRCGDLDIPRLEDILASGRPGVGVLRAAYGLSCPRRESPMETVLGLFHAAMEIPVAVQVDLHDDEGTFLGRGDLQVVGTHDIHEYDGADHRDGTQHRADLRRERAWAGTPYRRRGFTLDDLLNHSAVVMHELDRALGRPHAGHRLERWRTLVRESLYDEVGRSRLLNRWRRAMGVVQWS